MKLSAFDIRDPVHPAAVQTIKTDRVPTKGLASSEERVGHGLGSGGFTLYETHGCLPSALPDKPYDVFLESEQGLGD